MISTISFAERHNWFAEIMTYVSDINKKFWLWYGI